MDAGTQKRLQKWLAGLTLPKAVEAETRLDHEVSRMQRKLTMVRGRVLELSRPTEPGDDR